MAAGHYNSKYAVFLTFKNTYFHGFIDKLK